MTGPNKWAALIYHTDSRDAFVTELDNRYEHSNMSASAFHSMSTMVVGMDNKTADFSNSSKTQRDNLQATKTRSTGGIVSSMAAGALAVSHGIIIKRGRNET